MKQFWKWLIRTKDMLHTVNSGWCAVHATEGRWRVRYSDGRLSQRFDYWTARGYAEIFGGTVEHLGKRQD